MNAVLTDETFLVYTLLTSHAEGLITVYHFRVKAYVHFTVCSLINIYLLQNIQKIQTKYKGSISLLFTVPLSLALNTYFLGQ